MKWFLGVILALLGTALPIGAANTEAKLLLSETASKPGSTVTAAVVLKMAPGWHTYWKNPGDSGKATKVEWTLPDGFAAAEVEWPVPKKGKFEDLYTYEYAGEVALLVPITIAPNASPGPKTLKAKLTWFECEKVCIRVTGQVEASLTVGADSTPSPKAARIAEWKSKIPKAASDIEIAAKWEGRPANEDKRSLIFTVNKPDGDWDFYNYALDNADVKTFTERLAAEAGKVRFRKAVEKIDGDWPKELKGILLIAADEKSARETTVSIADGGTAASTSSQDPVRNVATTQAGSNSTSAGNHTLLGILGLAFLGGLILNVMPCVLPVISLKILGFVRQANSDSRKIRKLGLVYGLGVIVSFMVLAGFVIAVKQSSGSATWGMQFQNPKFLLLLTSLVTLIALNLFGVFEINLGGRTMNAAGELASKEGSAGAFFNGALATILATPCTAPILATALGFAFAQTNGVIALVFFAIALGMALPYVVLCWFPAWLKKLPKPGPWMERFKHAMGFPMLATAVWLYWVSLDHFNKNGPLILGLFLVTIGCAAWVYGEFVQRGLKNRGLSGLVATGLLAFAIFYFPAQLSKLEDWSAWSRAAVEEARAKGHPVLVDFTAKWCLTCKVNKKTSINIDSVREKLKDLNYATFVADNTTPTPEIDKELQAYQRAGVPLVLVFPADPEATPIVLPELLTPTIVLEALDKAAGGKNLKFTKKIGLSSQISGHAN